MNDMLFIEIDDGEHIFMGKLPGIVKKRITDSILVDKPKRAVIL